MSLFDRMNFGAEREVPLTELAMAMAAGVGPGQPAHDFGAAFGHAAAAPMGVPACGLPGAAHCAWGLPGGLPPAGPCGVPPMGACGVPPAGPCGLPGAAPGAYGLPGAQAGAAAHAACGHAAGSLTQTHVVAAAPAAPVPQAAAAAHFAAQASQGMPQAPFAAQAGQGMPAAHFAAQAQVPAVTVHRHAPAASYGHFEPAAAGASVSHPCVPAAAYGHADPALAGAAFSHASAPAAYSSTGPAATGAAFAHTYAPAAYGHTGPAAAAGATYSHAYAPAAAGATYSQPYAPAAYGCSGPAAAGATFPHAYAPAAHSIAEPAAAGATFSHMHVPAACSPAEPTAAPHSYSPTGYGPADPMVTGVTVHAPLQVSAPMPTAAAAPAVVGLVHAPAPQEPQAPHFGQVAYAPAPQEPHAPHFGPAAVPSPRSVDAYRDAAMLGGLGAASPQVVRAEAAAPAPAAWRGSYSAPRLVGEGALQLNGVAAPRMVSAAGERVVGERPISREELESTGNLVDAPAVEMAPAAGFHRLPATYARHPLPAQPLGHAAAAYADHAEPHRRALGATYARPAAPAQLYGGGSAQLHGGGSACGGGSSYVVHTEPPSPSQPHAMEPLAGGVEHLGHARPGNLVTVI